MQKLNNLKRFNLAYISNTIIQRVKGEEGRAVSAHGGGVKLLKIAGEKEERVWESMTNSLNPITASSFFISFYTFYLFILHFQGFGSLKTPVCQEAQHGNLDFLHAEGSSLHLDRPPLLTFKLLSHFVFLFLCI